MAETEDWQRSLNRQTEGGWASFTSHRQHVTELLSGRAEGLRLCVLGAGNCNDVDLRQLVPRFRQIVLVDLDVAAVTRAAQRQPAAVQSVLELRAPIDFSAQGELASGTTEASPSGLAIAKRLSGTIDPEPFDIVASTCVLSQLVDQVRAQLENESERCLQVVQQVREVHLALLLQLLRPGGRGVLISDMVSSDTAPELNHAAPQELPELMAKLVSRKNFFTGINPFVIDGLLKQHPLLAPLVARSAFHRPWLWQLTPSRAYLTFALSFQRR
jgi:hypothetical protein